MVAVCDRWRESFDNFLVDMGERPDGKTLDRIDSNGDYCKENCRWATVKEQCNNTSRNVSITINGESRTPSQWADITGVSPRLIYQRHKRGETDLFRPPENDSAKKDRAKL